MVSPTLAFDSLTLTHTYTHAHTTHCCRLFLYLACCVVTLVPQALLEFRYYIIPYLLFRIHSPRPSLLGIVAELVTYTAINMATLFLFLRRPFLWPDTDQLQRFMW